MELIGERVYIRPLGLEDAGALAALLADNREFLEPFEPMRPASDFTVEGQRDRIEQAISERNEDRAYAFSIFDLAGTRLVGRVALSNVVRAAWQNATLGYWVARSDNGRGFATEAVRLALRYAFEHSGLHRVQAGVMPRNKASVRVLVKAGMRHEGLSLRYLKINGVWEDHEMFAMTAEEWLG